MENIQIRFGIRLKQLRNEKGISQEQFAGLADIDRTYVADIESGKRNVSIAIAEKIAKAFGLSLAELFSNL